MSQSDPDRVRSEITVRRSDSRSDVERPLELFDREPFVQTIRYQENGQQVGYQGGGVWRMTESGATMSSPPAVNYDQGALSVSFANISGQQIGGNSVAIRSNATAERPHEAALQMALFTDVSYEDARTGSFSSPSYECPPSQVANATLTIKNSSYARAWADWARSTYDDQYVTVTPASAEPGETIHVRFALGDVSGSVHPQHTGGLAKLSPRDEPTEVARQSLSTERQRTLSTFGAVPSEATTQMARVYHRQWHVVVAAAKPHNFTVESDHDTPG